MADESRFANIVAEGLTRHGNPARSWGDWRYNPFAFTLEYALEYVDPDRPAHVYQISLEDCKRAAGLLNWIFHLRIKTWVTDKVMADFLRAVDDLFHPEATMCHSGEIDPHEVVKNHNYPVASEEDRADVRMLANDLSDIDDERLYDAFERLRVDGVDFDEVLLLCDRLDDYDLTPDLRAALCRLQGRYAGC
jgi:hypothetical protein